MNIYHVKGINKSIKPPCSYEANIPANDSTEAAQFAMMEMNWQGKILSCKAVE